jgi:nitrogen fixation protein FixH
MMGALHSGLMRGGPETGLVAMNMPAAAQKAYDEANARHARTASELAGGETLSLEAARARVQKLTREP